MKAESAYGAGIEQIHNFSKEENQALTRVGPGSLMGKHGIGVGALLRQHCWRSIGLG